MVNLNSDFQGTREHLREETGILFNDAFDEITGLISWDNTLGLKKK